jgi:hypothetical protein
MAQVAVVDSIAVDPVDLVAVEDTTVIAVVMAVVVNTTDINQPRCNTIPFRISERDFFCPVHFNN